MDVTDMEDRKTCHTCGKTKSIESFYPYKRYKDGHLGSCKRCYLAKQQVYKDRVRASHRGLMSDLSIRYLERLNEALDMWGRFGPKRGDNPGTPLSDLNEIVKAARLLAGGRSTTWCKKHDAAQFKDFPWCAYAEPAIHTSRRTCRMIDVLIVEIGEE